MIDTSKTRRLCVLHIRPTTPAGSAYAPASSSLDEWLSAPCFSVESYGDVYRSLARILGSHPVPIDAVFVCMDVVDIAEDEFFSLLARIRRNLKVYVYTNGPDSSRTGHAIQRGAVGLASREVVRDLGASAELREASLPRVTPAPVETAPTLPPAPTQPAVVAPSPPTEEEDLGAPPDEPVEEEVDESATRVPWLRYANRPTRAAPPSDRRAPRTTPSPAQGEGWGDGSAQPAAAGADGLTPRDDAYEPLLTEAELEALMSDDISTIAPKEPRRRPPGDASPWGKP